MKKNLISKSIAFLVALLVMTGSAFAMETVDANYKIESIQSIKTINGSAIQPYGFEEHISFSVGPGELVYVNVGFGSAVDYELSYTPSDVAIYHGIDSDKDPNVVMVANSSKNGTGSGFYSGVTGQKYVYVFNDSASRSISVNMTYLTTTALR